MSKSNLRQTLDAFTENVNLRLPTTLHFDGERLYLTADATAGAVKAGVAKVGITDDLTDDTVYRLIGDDIDQVSEEMGVKLTEEDLTHIQKGDTQVPVKLGPVGPVKPVARDKAHHNDQADLRPGVPPREEEEKEHPVEEGDLEGIRRNNPQGCPGNVGPEMDDPDHPFQAP